VIKSRAILTTTTNPAQKLELSEAVSKLANAILVLTASRSKLDSQVKDLVSKKALLTNAPEQLAENIDDAKGSAELLCVKGF
jgi:outer membrane murein-binding lipoprotein Lpp